VREHPNVALTSPGRRLNGWSGADGTAITTLGPITRLLEIELRGSRADPHALSAQRFLRSFFT
jgi:hypothetical protein